MISLGAVETFRFSLTTRSLTAAELATFVAGGGLPAGVGEDAAVAKVEYQGPTDAEPTVSTVVVHDSTGAYHSSLALNEEGVWRWRGLLYGGGGEPLSATAWYEVTVGEEAPESTVAQLVASVLEDGQFDASEAQALRWLNTRHRQLCARTRCYRRVLDLGATVGGKSAYALPAGVVEILQVNIGGLPYGASRHSDFAEGERGYIWLGGGEGGIAGRDDSESGQQLLRIFPAPQVALTPEPGSEITVYAAMQPPPLVVGQDSTIKVPDDYFDALVSGAIATGMLRVETREDLAAPHEQIFTTAVGELLRATNRKYRGAGPARVRILGINA